MVKYLITNLAKKDDVNQSNPIKRISSINSNSNDNITINKYWLRLLLYIILLILIIFLLFYIIKINNKLNDVVKDLDDIKLKL